MCIRDSPYPGSTQTPKLVIKDHSKMISNPFVRPVKAEAKAEKPADSDSASNDTDPKLLWVVNPYVDQSPTASEVRMANK